jgi:hypothetical protein
MCSVWAQKTRLKFGLTWVGFQEENAHRGLAYTAQGSGLLNKGMILTLVGVLFFAVSMGVTWWSNRLPTDQRSMIFSVSLVVSWVVFILGLFLWPYIVGGP